MTYARPSYEHLRDRIAADLAAMPDVLRGPLSAAWARACHGEHGHLDWLYDQCTPLACEEERLADWALLYAVNRLDATAAEGAVTCTGSPGATVLAGSLARGPNGLDYQVQAAASFAGPSNTITTTARVRCTTAGANGNLPVGAKLTLIDPLAGVSSELVAGADGLGGGAEREAVEGWRARVVDEWVAVTTDGARGGRRADYVYWAKSAHPSVTGALVQLHALGLGTVIVRPICNDLPNRLPTAAVKAAVLAKLQAAAPYMPDKTVGDPAMVPVAVRVLLNAAVDNAQNRAAVTAALVALVKSEQVDGAVLGLGEIDAAIAQVTLQYTRLSPLADIVCGAGQALALPSVAWA